jgi:hypothetical protein
MLQRWLLFFSHGWLSGGFSISSVMGHWQRSPGYHDQKGGGMTDRKVLAQQLREDALLVLAKMHHEGEKIAYRMGMAADLLDGRAEQGIEQPRAPDS